MNKEYNASSIKILDGVELAEISYMKIADIANKYHKPLEVVKIAYEACMLAGLDFEDFYVAKYCKNENIPLNKDFSEIYDDLRTEQLQSRNK